MVQKSSSDFWYMAGNFSLNPNISELLCVIRSALCEHAVSCVYAILSEKSQQIYQEMLQTVVGTMEDLHIFLDPRVVVGSYSVVGLRVKNPGRINNACENRCDTSFSCLLDKIILHSGQPLIVYAGTILLSAHR